MSNNSFKQFVSERTNVIKNTTTEKLNNFNNYLTSGHWHAQIIFVLIICFLLFIIIKISFDSILYIKYKLSGKTWLYKNGATKKAEIYTSVEHGDVTPNALKDIMRSVNETSGMEFSYTMWLFCKDWTTYKKGQWKHILHKGDHESWPGRAPGIWFHPDFNILRVYMNTFESIADNYVDISNIPIKKWFHLSVVLSNRYLDVYINGLLKKRLVLNGIARQNYGKIHINRNEGFSGFMSRIRYYDYAINPLEIEYEVKQGPSPIQSESYEKPPYLSTNYWLNNYS